MGYKEINVKLPTDYDDRELRGRLERMLKIDNFSFHITNKSLDARKKDKIHWLTKIAVISDEIKGDMPITKEPLRIPYKKRDKKAVIVGSGPAGFFTAYVLQKAGFATTIIERGTKVEKREKGITSFEETGMFDSKSNYAFGEGGAGTFSDGKLTSRSKRISQEKQFIFSSYIDAGAPKEIAYLAHPHLGSNNLKDIVKNLRNQFLEIGGEILFETMLEDIKVVDGKVTQAITSEGVLDADYFIVASGHSAYETYKMLMKRGVQFGTKNFAIGSRIEHPQRIVNLAQWGKEELPGVKAAEYRLTSKGNGKQNIYTFCMCPGGSIVPSTPYQNSSIVNGMSMYNRDSEFANSAVVAGIHPDQLLNKVASPQETLDILEKLEMSFFNYSKGYRVPYCNINDFIKKRESFKKIDTSYPLGTMPAPLWELLPPQISSALREGLKDFNKKIRGFTSGNIMGLESKTSAPIQALREENRLCSGFKNLYFVGEGSGFAGGIVSSAADGIKTAMAIID
ncbi:MAG: FAD-dependent monooxygenase [Bacteroidota bacterium]|nr:FAD-dependent monooxygenase [Bacteroidota bacterium]